MNYSEISWEFIEEFCMNSEMVLIALVARRTYGVSPGRAPVDEMAAEEAEPPARETQGDPSREPAGKHLNGFSTDDMMKKLGNIDPAQFGVGAGSGQ